MKGFRVPKTKRKEKDLHKKLKEYGEGRGGTCVKLTTLGMYGMAGMPDQLWLFPGAIIFFMELKRDETEGCTDLQLERQNDLRKMGFHVYVVSDEGKGKEIINSELRRERVGRRVCV